MDLSLNILEDMAAAFERGTIRTEHGLEWRVPAYQGYGTCCWTTDSFGIYVRAHRVAWILENGPIPPGYDVDHDPRCPKTCVTVAHLQILTKSDHARLGWERGELNGGWGTKRERIHPPGPVPFAWRVERPCKNCGTEFIPTTPKNLHCSRDCHYNYKEALRKPRRNPRPASKICQLDGCDVVFAPKRIDSKFCSRKCIDANQARRQKERRTRPLARVCQWDLCDETFVPKKYDDARFCSSKCYYAFYYQYQRKYQRKEGGLDAQSS